MTSRHILIAALALLTGLVAFQLFQALEFYEEEIDIGFTQEARSNPLLAAELYLQEGNVQVTSTQRFEELADIDRFDTLFVSSSNQIFSVKRLNSVLEWLDGGGHLIVGASASLASSDFNERDPLLREFSIYQVDHYNDDSNQDPEPGLDVETLRATLEADVDNTEDKSRLEIIRAFEEATNPDHISTLNFNDFDDEIRAHFAASTRLWHPSLSDEESEVDYTHEPFYADGDNHGINILQFEIGYGLLTVLSTSHPFESRNIDKFEHAMLWDILAGSSDNAAILYGIQAPSLWSMVRAFAPEILLTLALLVAVWIFHEWPRFGSAVTIETRTRRALTEHIQASSSYLWNNEGRGSMLSVVVDELDRRARQEIDGYGQANAELRAELLSQRSGIASQRIFEAINTAFDDKLSEESFKGRIVTLQAIRKSL